MKGVIIGDIVGSFYERHNTKAKDFKLFKNKCRFTDDTVLTAAVADALLQTQSDEVPDDAKALRVLTQKMQEYFRRHTERGGSKFFTAWANSNDPQPYNGYTNGALMRCSAAGWLADSVEKARHLGELTALPSHNHPEAIAAASLAAEIIFRARNGATKEELLKIAQDEYEIPSIETLRSVYRYDISCKGTFPVAFASFYESVSFEDTIRTAVSLGGDTDTNAAIAGSFAEAFYGVPDDLWEMAKTYCTEDILDVVAQWEAFCMEQISVEHKIGPIRQITPNDDPMGSINQNDKT